MALLRLKGKLWAQLPVPCPAASGSWLPFLIGQVCHSPFGPPLWLGSRGLSPDLTRPPHIYFSLAFGGLRSACDPSPSFLIFILFRGWMLPSRYSFLLFVPFSGPESVESPPTLVQPCFSFFSGFCPVWSEVAYDLASPVFYTFCLFTLFMMFMCFLFIYRRHSSYSKGSKTLPCPIPAGAVPV